MNVSPFIPFDPEAVAKTVSIGRLVVLFQDTRRDEYLIHGPKNDLEVFKAALFLLYGSLALTPENARRDIILPKTSSDKDPDELLRMAERNYKEVFKSRREATDLQKQVAFNSIALASKKLEDQGYGELSWHINDYLRGQRFVLRLPMAMVEAKARTPHL